MNEPKFPHDAEKVRNTLVEVLKHQKQEGLANVLLAGLPTIEFLYHDDWEGGIDCFAFSLSLPLDKFAQIEPNLEKYEQVLGAKLPRLFRNAGDCVIRSFSINANIDQSGWEPTKIHAANEPSRIWSPGTLRLFISHTSRHKVQVGALKDALDQVGAHAFVAHEDIAPSVEWQDEILEALRTMHAFVAIVTDDFKDSYWTNQEVGYALARRVLIVPVRTGSDPTGFIARKQAVPIGLSESLALSQRIMGCALQHPPIRSMVIESLVNRLVTATHFKSSIEAMKLLSTIDTLSEEQLERLIKACENNAQVYNATGVPEAISRLESKLRR